MSQEAEVRELELLRKLIRNRMNDYTDDMAGGSCSSFPEYRYLCGIIAGLAISERELLDLDGRLVRDND